MYTSVIIARKSLLSLETYVSVGALLIIKHLSYPRIPWAEFWIPKLRIPRTSGNEITLPGAVSFFFHTGDAFSSFHVTACFVFATVFIWLHIPCDSDRDGRFCRRCCRKQCSSWPTDERHIVPGSVLLSPPIFCPDLLAAIDFCQQFRPTMRQFYHVHSGNGAWHWMGRVQSYNCWKL